MPAVEVFGAAIRYLKDHALMQIRQRASDFHDTDIDWVLTVPAIWEDGAKQCMTLAANEEWKDERLVFDSAANGDIESVFSTSDII
ncbi:hypothetical protein DPMN_059046 [Dreissena polymorpha]|uniref:Uncharacterized protein n=1 Tax=Dreissena polymorpha TaxID=45954 RepID=A0A9D4C392_DREPO|nr:hypothetical protein DPMN_059046 [Dreissena polymorpha]